MTEDEGACVRPSGEHRLTILESTLWVSANMPDPL